MRVRPAPMQLITGDAREVSRLLRGRAVDVILTSPPYGGTYDYVEHHALRLDWLNLPRAAFERAEIGARRHEDNGERWDRELGASLAAMRSVLRGPASRVALVIGDAQLGPRRIDAHAHVLALCPKVGLRQKKIVIVMCFIVGFIAMYAASIGLQNLLDASENTRAPKSKHARTLTE